jgi:TonB family protein
VNPSRSPLVLHKFNRVFLVFSLVIISSIVSLSQETVGPAPSPADAAKTSIEVAKPEATQPSVERLNTADPAKSAEASQTRIERARALIAAHRLDIAASELESVRGTTQDNALRNITSIMLMNVYLEEGNYGRAEALLEESFKARTAQKDDTLGNFFALAGQAVNGARTHLGRYRNFGISTAGASLPPEAVSDLNRLRSLLERMIAQAKEISVARRAYDSLSLLEDVLGLRLSLAKDSEDQIKWETEYAGARESLASSQTQIASLGGIPPLRPGKTPGKNAASPSPYSTKKTSEPLAIKAPDKDHVSAEGPSATGIASSSASSAPSAAGDSRTTIQPPSDSAAESPVMEAGSLNAKATKKVVPRYPPLARQLGAAGSVRVHVIVDEAGRVIAVSRSEGPMLLRFAAEEAARQWAFEGASSDGRSTRLSGYIDFTFTL